MYDTKVASECSAVYIESVIRGIGTSPQPQDRRTEKHTLGELRMRGIATGLSVSYVHEYVFPLLVLYSSRIAESLGRASYSSR